jgi:hypothetical protein
MVGVSSHVPSSGTAESRADPAWTYAASGRRLRRAATAVCVVLGATVVAFALAVQTYSPFRHPVLFVAGGLAVMTGVSALSVFVATARHMIHTPLPASLRTTPTQQRPRIGTVRDIPLFVSSLVIVFAVLCAAGTSPRRDLGERTQPNLLKPERLPVSNCDARGPLARRRPV